MVATNIWALPIAILVFIAGGIAFFYQMKHQGQAKKTITIPQSLPPEGFLIPLQSARFGVSDMANTEGNRFNTYIKLFGDHFDFNVLNNHSYKYSDVKGIGYVDGYYGNVTLVITFNGTDNNYYGYMYKNNLKTIFNFFQSKGCKLTEKALNFNATT